MIEITEAYIDSIAPNAGAMKNGRDLVKKNSFPKLCRSEDGTLLFGECKGSGKEPYRCSADFVKPESPVFRCSCPSRQFPCKHNLGLLYAYAGGEPFAVEEIPTDVADKRSKIEQREEKKKEAAAGGETEPVKRKTNQSALVKKMAAQLEGIELLHKLIRQIAQAGFASIDAKTMKMLDDQAKQLGNYYVPGLQHAFRELLLVLQSEDDQERVYTEAVDKLTLLHRLVLTSRDYIEARRQNPERPMDTVTPLEEAIGYAWQAAELKECGLARSDVELLQLAFRSYANEARGEYVDEGWWVRLDTGELHTVRTYRPYRAAKYMKEEDSCFSVVKAKELFVYPGQWAPRARWEDMTMRDAGPEDRAAVISHGKRLFAETIKAVKQELLHPLSGKRPVALLAYAKLGLVGERYVLEDEAGTRVTLGDIRSLAHPGVQLLPLLGERIRRDAAMLVMFGQGLPDGGLIAQPLCLVTDSETVRFIY